MLGLWLRWAAAGGEKVEELGEGGGDGSEAAVPRLQGAGTAAGATGASRRQRQLQSVSRQLRTA